MLFLRAFAVTLLVISSGCAAVHGSEPASTLPIRVLTTELPTLKPTASPSDAAASARDAGKAPRIGAPGGSGAGSRRVMPAQSGNETVGGLPAGIGTGTGASRVGGVAGRG